MHQSSSESSIDKNKFPSVINLYASDHEQSIFENTPQNYDNNFGTLSVLTDDNRFEMNTLYTIEERNLSNFKISDSESSLDNRQANINRKSSHLESESETSVEESGQDRVSTTSTSTSSDEGLLTKTKSKPKTQSYIMKVKNDSEHQSLCKKQIPEDIRSLKTQPNCPSSPSLWSSSTSGKFANIFSKKVSIRGSFSQDVSQYRHSVLSSRTGLGSISHGLRLNSQAADSGISNTSPDTLSSTEFYQRNIEDSKIVSKCNRLASNFSWQGTNIPPSILKHKRRNNQSIDYSISNFKTLIFQILSMIYIFILLMIILVLSISDQRNIPGTNNILEIFQIFQYAFSILFLMIFHLSDCKRPPKRFPISSFSSHRYHDIEPENCLILSNPVSFELQDKIIKDSTEMTSFHENIVSNEVLNVEGSTRSTQINDLSKALFESLFKISILIVGVIGIIKNVIELATEIDIEQANMGKHQECHSITVIIRSFLSLLFSIIQTYFVFLDYKSIVTKLTFTIIFGVVHLTATNLNAVLHNLISTKSFIRIIKQKENVFTLPSTAPAVLTKGITTTHFYNTNETDCLGAEVMGQINNVSDIYLYPFSIQYGILTTVINLLLLSSLDSVADVNVSCQSNTAFKSLRESSSETVRMRSSNCRRLTTINCKSSNRGFFIGLFSLLIAIISLILLYIFSKKSQLRLVGMKISYLTEMILTIINTLVTVTTLYHLRDISLLSYPSNPNKIESANRILMFISLFGGIYLYNISCILAWRTVVNIPSAPFAMITSLCSIIHGSLQTIYILLTIAKISLSDPVSIKNTRKEYISFILMNNIALWCLKIFTELQQNSVENIPEIIYGHIGWIIIKRISIPLTLLYQIISIISLAVIWKIM